MDLNVPIVELFVKASSLDRRNMGPNPLAQQYFMAYSILDQQGFLILQEVITINLDSPPVEYVDLNVGSKLPVLRVISGYDQNGANLAGLVLSMDDELEEFIARFGCADLQTSRQSQLQKNIEKNLILDLYSKFNIFLKNPDSQGRAVLDILRKIDGHLANNGVRFLLADNLTLADCLLLPRLHHVRVAGKDYRNFDIPGELVHVWAYLSAAYQSEIFTQSCPADQDIIQHYETKAVTRPRTNPHTQLERQFSFGSPGKVN